MALTRDILLERKASLEANVAQIESVIEQANADLQANHGALQQVLWDLEQFDEEEDE